MRTIQPMNIVQPGEIRGYNEDVIQAVRRGQIVTIYKGVLVSNYHTGEKLSGKTYKVKVDHVLPGIAHSVGWWDSQTGQVTFQQMDGKHTDPFFRAYGTRNLEDLVFYMHTRTGASSASGRLHYLYLPLENPKIRWAGTGGYWSEADINDIL